MEHAQHSQPGEPIAGVALPFKPSASDIARAIEGLGYSPRNIFREDLPGLNWSAEEARSGKSSLRPLVLVFLTMLFVVFLFAF